MIGYVGESPETIRETVDLVCEMDVGSFAGWFRYVTPLPGTTSSWITSVARRSSSKPRTPKTSS